MRVFALILWTLTIVAAQYAGAATTSTRGNVSATDPFGIDALKYERAPVMLDGQLLFKARGLPAYPAEERAREITKRIVEIVADRSVAAESLRAVEMEDRTRIAAGDSRLRMLTLEFRNLVP